MEPKDASNCTPCGLGNYRFGDGCLACSTGTVNDAQPWATNSSACHACPSVTAYASANACVEASDGYVPNADSNGQQACSAGSYRSRYAPHHPPPTRGPRDVDMGGRAGIRPDAPAAPPAPTRLLPRHSAPRAPSAPSPTRAAWTTAHSASRPTWPLPMAPGRAAFALLAKRFTPPAHARCALATRSRRWADAPAAQRAWCPFPATPAAHRAATAPFSSVGNAPRVLVCQPASPFVCCSPCPA